MGEVFLAEDRTLGRQVALKILPPELAEGTDRLARFLREARAASAFSHPHIAHVYELGEADGLHFIAMELVEGETLSRRIGSLNTREVVTIAIQIADALAAAGEKGIIHRDIKPSNIMLDARGAVKVLDFGLAKVRDESTQDTVDRNPQTATGTVMGTVPYMSPEQAMGRSVDGRSDIFSFGIVLYEMLTGRRPFAGVTTTEIIDNIVHQTPEPMARFNYELPMELERITRKCLEKSAGLRYQSARELLIDLQRVSRELTEPVTVRRSGPDLETVVMDETRERSTPPQQRWVMPVSIAAVILIAAAAIAIALSMRHAPPDVAKNAIHSLAVLPLVNNSGNPQADYLPDGISEDLIHDFSQLPALRVMSRNSVFRFKGQNVDAQAVAKKLGVGAVLTGDFRQAGDLVTINIELIDASDGSLIFSKKYSQQATDLVALQSDIAHDVVERLRLKISGEDQQFMTRGTATNAEAYQLRLKGRFHASRQMPAELHEAIRYFEEAVKKDPDYALAYSAMAESYIELALFYESPKETMPLAKSYALKALQIDPTLVDAHATLGLISLVFDWNWPAASQELVSSSGMNHAAVETFSCTAHVMQSLGRSGDAIREIRRALVIDPLSSTLNTELGCSTYYTRDYRAAIREYNEALTINAGNPEAQWGLGRSYNQLKMYPEAIRELKKAQAPNGDAPPIITSELAFAYARSGRRAEAEQLLNRLLADQKTMYVDAYLIALVYLGLNDKPHMYEFLDRAYAARSSFLVSMVSEPKLDELRNDDQFKELIRRIGFPSPTPTI
ncbi:MAG: eukaryotic-like serine/threonine-protein kinase [Thermoanaerobaculia bacterium]|jgi:serine/threonine protein kinase/tetratricopeptide (TPR) repeat protein|nr:eukaryotic-like serine/threonine-protein kinase [Thermoanaerobaculia bacterium]